MYDDSENIGEKISSNFTNDVNKNLSFAKNTTWIFNIFLLNVAKILWWCCICSRALFIDFASETEVQTQKVAKRLQWESVDSTQNMKS